MSGFRIINFAVILSVALVCTPARCTDEGFVLGAVCLGCHANNKTPNEIPKLTGYKQETVFSKMRAYRNGDLDGTIMPRLAAGYTDEQLQSLARWLASDR